MVLRPQGLLPERRRKLELTAAIPAGTAAAKRGSWPSGPEGTAPDGTTGGPA